MVRVLTAMVFGNTNRSSPEKTQKSYRGKNDTDGEENGASDRETYRKQDFRSKPRRRKIPVVLREALSGSFRGLPTRLRKACGEIVRDMPISMLLVVLPVAAVGISAGVTGALFFGDAGSSDQASISPAVGEATPETESGRPSGERSYLRLPATSVLDENPISMVESSLIKSHSSGSINQDMDFLESKADMEFAAQNYKEAEHLYQALLQTSRHLSRNAPGKSALLRKMVFRIFASQLAQGHRAEASVVFAQFDAQSRTGIKPPEWYYGRALMAYVDKDFEGGWGIVKAARAQNFLHTEIYENTLRQMGYEENEEVQP